MNIGAQPNYNMMPHHPIGNNQPMQGYQQFQQ
jgi:hypothetical protein